MARKRCVARFPKLKHLHLAISILKRMYPEDPIELVDRGALESAISMARHVFRSWRGSCLDRKVAAGVRLFYEIIQLHPLVDGNKRLATLLLGAYLIVNGLTTKRAYLKELAIKVARGELDFEGAVRWLRDRVKRKRGS